MTEERDLVGRAVDGSLTRVIVGATTLLGDGAALIDDPVEGIVDLGTLAGGASGEFGTAVAIAEDYAVVSAPDDGLVYKRR